MNRIVVAYKWAANPQDAAVRPDGSTDWARARPGVSDYDPAAIELGRTMADATGAELVGITVDGATAATAMARKAALALGLDRVVVATGGELAERGATATAVALAAVVRDLGDVDVVLTGDASIDRAEKLVPATLGGVLGWPCLLEVTGATAAGGGLLVTRRHRGGSQSLTVSEPAVLACAPGATGTRVPGMRDIMAAGRRPSEHVDVSALDAPALVVLERRRAEPPPRRRQILANMPADAAASVLVAALRRDGVIG